MVIRISPWAWDQRFLRYEHIAADGHIDRVTFAPADGQDSFALVREAIARRRVSRMWSLLGYGFLAGLAAGSTSAALSILV